VVGGAARLTLDLDVVYRRDAENLLTTTLGDIDLLGEITGGGYEALLPHCILLEPFGVPCHCLGHVKRAAGRPKDFEAVAELEAIREEPEGP
jgi:hypothetical protein